MATDGKGSYREAMLETWGQVPEYGGRGRPPTHKQPDADWRSLQVVKEHVFQSAHRRAYTGGLWGPAIGESFAGGAYGLCGTHTSHLTTYEWTPRSEELILLEATQVIGYCS